MKRVKIDELLSMYRPVVPEIQRDYVWGENPQVLEQFIGDLSLKLSKADKEANIGFLYSYPRGNENYVIDGQQRLTTMLLLLYVLSLRNEGDRENFQKTINLDGRNTAFSYRVRPTSLSFMKMLFKSGCTKSEQVRDLKDYKLCYDQDPTAQSCLKAIDWFTKNIERWPNITYRQILDNVEFWYFSVDQTSQGEELYITMNSRGEALTGSEAIKPRLFDKLKDGGKKQQFGKKWDDWEEFFYQHRNGGIDAVDTAMDNLVSLVSQLKKQDFSDKGNYAAIAESIWLEDLDNYMTALTSIYKESREKHSFIADEIKRLYGDAKKVNGLNDGDFNVLKAILTAKVKGCDIYQVEQVYHLIRNLIVRGILKRPKEFLEFLQQWGEGNKHIYEFFLDYANSHPDSGVTNTEHEKVKIRIFQEHGNDAEKQIWKAQETDLWEGDLKVLVEWATTGGRYSMAEFDRLYGLMDRLFDEYDTDRGKVKTDLVRRGLLTTLNVDTYPWHQYDSQVYFGCNAWEWRQIFAINKTQLLGFLNDFDHSGLSAEDFCKVKIDACPTDRKWAEFVKAPYLLEYLNTMHISYTDNRGWFLEKNSYAQQISVNDKHLYHYLGTYNEKWCEKGHETGYWLTTAHEGNDNRVLVTDNIARVGIWYEREALKTSDGSPTGIYNQHYIVRIQLKGEDSKGNHEKLARFASEFTFEKTGGLSLKFQWNNNWEIKVPFAAENDWQSAAAIVRELVEAIFASQSSVDSWNNK